MKVKNQGHPTFFFNVNLAQVFDTAVKLMPHGTSTSNIEVSGSTPASLLLIQLPPDARPEEQQMMVQVAGSVSLLGRARWRSCGTGRDLNYYILAPASTFSILRRISILP